MKKILIVLTLFTGMIACENQVNDFPDFDYTTGYFPYQYPVRTLVLGDYIYDNTNDNNHKFLISAAMGGVYSNTKDREFDIEVAPDLCNNVLFESTKDTIRMMPSNYYTLSSATKLIIPAGKVNGNIEVQLTDAFFDDPLAIKLGFVIPIRIVNATNLDSVLRGNSTITNPDPRVAGQWTVIPKDFTMFAVKYVNPYHGNYFHRGSSIVKDASGNVVENNVYRTPYIINNKIWSLTTTGKNQVTSNSNINSLLFTGILKMNLSLANDGTCTVTQATDSPFPISGTGKFLEDGDEWGGKKRNSMVLSYNYSVQYTPVQVVPTIVDDNNASVAYSSGWSTGDEAASYGNSRHYSLNPGNSFTYNFTGVAFALYFKTGSAYGTFDLYLDNMSVPIVTDVSVVTPTTLYQQKIFEKTGLTNGSHTIKVVVKQSKYVIFDYLTYTTYQNPLPAGTYTFEAKDTLVNRDRAVTMEVYNPVVY